MKSTKTISTKSDIIEALHSSFEEISTFLDTTPDDIFYQRIDDKWSIAENLDHLVLSNKPLASVLKKNKLFFLTFGFSFKGSENFETLKANYHLKLSQLGPPPNSGFSPKNSKDTSKQKFQENWKMIGEKYAPRLAKWSEKDLDRFRLPHPLLGKLTFREMLFFTIFHNDHHLRRMRQLKENLSA